MFRYYCVSDTTSIMSYLDLRVSVPPLFIGLLLWNSRHGVNDVRNELCACCILTKARQSASVYTEAAEVFIQLKK